MITSSENDRIKHVRALQSRSRTRHKEERFVIEGPKLLLEAVQAGVPVEEVYYTESFAAQPEGLSVIEFSQCIGRIPHDSR